MLSRRCFTSLADDLGVLLVGQLAGRARSADCGQPPSPSAGSSCGGCRARAWRHAWRPRAAAGGSWVHRPRGVIGLRRKPPLRRMGSGRASVWRLCARGYLALLGFLALALHAGLLVVLAASCLGQDAGLLNLLVEPTQRALERLVLAHANFCQTSRLLPALDFAPVLDVAGSPAGHVSRCRVAAGPMRVNRASAPSADLGIRAVDDRAVHDRRNDVHGPDLVGRGVVTSPDRIVTSPSEPGAR